MAGYQPSPEEFKKIIAQRQSNNVAPEAGRVPEENQEGGDEVKGLTGVGIDIVNMLGNALKGVLNVPEHVRETKQYFKEKPYEATTHNVGQVRAGTADLIKGIANTAPDLTNYLLKKELHPTNLVEPLAKVAFDMERATPQNPFQKEKSYEGKEEISNLVSKNLKGSFPQMLSRQLINAVTKNLPKIPENTGAEELFGTQPKPGTGDELFRELPAVATGALGAGKTISGGTKWAMKPSKKKVKLREFDQKLDEVGKQIGLNDQQLKTLQEQLGLQYSSMFTEPLGEATPFKLEQSINIKKNKFEENPKKNEIPEGEVEKPPKRLDTTEMLAEHRDALEEAKKAAEEAVGINSDPTLRTGKKIKQKIEDLHKCTSNLYNNARDYLKNKNIKVDNTAEIKATTEELEKLKNEDELAPGYGSGTKEQTTLEETINALKSETVKASDIFTLMRTSQQQANRLRKMRVGATEQQYNSLTERSNKLDHHADKLAKKLEEVGDQNVKAMIKEANQGYRTFKTLTAGEFKHGKRVTNPIAEKAFYNGNVPNDSLIKLAEDRPGNEFLRAIIDKDPEIRKDLLAAYAGKKNVNALLNPSPEAAKHLAQLQLPNSMPALTDALHKYKNAIANYKTEARNANGLKKAQDEFIQSLKDTAEAKKLQQQIEFKKDALKQINAKLSEGDIPKAERAKLEKDKADYIQYLQDKGGKLKELGKLYAKIKLIKKIPL